MEREGWKKFRLREGYRYERGGAVWLNGDKWRWQLAEGEMFRGEEENLEDAMRKVEEGNR